MTAVTYQARRSLIPGHSANTSYSLDVRCSDIAIVRNQNRIVKRPIGGTNAEIIRWSGFNSYQVTAVPLAGTPLAALIEFLDSCEDQSFTFDPYGSIATPGTNPPPFLAIFGAQAPLIERVKKRRQGGANDYFRVSFLVEPA
jgi:hypothetical protein